MSDSRPEPTRDDLIALIDWLAIPYAADPVFVYPEEEHMVLVSAESIEYRRRLARTWEYVVGTKNREGVQIGG